MGGSVYHDAWWKGKSCFVRQPTTLTNLWQLFRYHEKSFQQKVELLYQRNLYVRAISLAQKMRIDSVQQNVIYRKYGDYLYQKQDYDAAMQQYLRAIDNTEPSQVIRKVKWDVTYEEVIN